MGCKECLGYDQNETFLDKAGNRFDKRNYSIFNK